MTDCEINRTAKGNELRVAAGRGTPRAYSFALRSPHVPEEPTQQP